MKNTPITENHLFRKAYANGRRASGKYTVLYALRDRAAGRLRRADPLHREINRLGLTVGKKTGSAVERNRAKRLMRESYRLIEVEGGVSHGYLLVIAARSAILGAREPEVRADMRRSLTQIGLLGAKAVKIPATESAPAPESAPESSSSSPSSSAPDKSGTQT